MEGKRNVYNKIKARQVRTSFKDCTRWLVFKKMADALSSRSLGFSYQDVQPRCQAMISYYMQFEI